MVGLVLACPVLAMLTACARAARFYKRNNISSRKRTFYWTAIVLSLTCAVAYLGYWVWLFCKLYSISVSLTFSLWLERCMYASVLVAAIAIACLYMGKRTSPSGSGSLCHLGRGLLLVTSTYYSLGLIRECHPAHTRGRVGRTSSKQYGVKALLFEPEISLQNDIYKDFFSNNWRRSEVEISIPNSVEFYRRLSSLFQ